MTFLEDKFVACKYYA